MICHDWHRWIGLSVCRGSASVAVPFRFRSLPPVVRGDRKPSAFLERFPADSSICVIANPLIHSELQPKRGAKGTSVLNFVVDSELRRELKAGEHVKSSQGGPCHRAANLNLQGHKNEKIEIGLVSIPQRRGKMASSDLTEFLL